MMWNSKYELLTIFITCFVSDNLCGDIEASIMHSDVRSWFVNSDLTEMYKQTTQRTAMNC